MERGESCWQSSLVFVPRTVSLGCRKEPDQALVAFHSLHLGLQLTGNLKYLQTKMGWKNVADGRYLPICRRSCSAEGHLPTACVRDLGLAPGRRQGRMTVFSLIRDKPLWPDELPPCPLPAAAASLQCWLPALGVLSGGHSPAHRQSGSVSDLQPDTKDDSAVGKANDLVCNRAQPGAPKQLEQPKTGGREKGQSHGQGQPRSTAAVWAQQPLPPQSGTAAAPRCCTALGSHGPPFLWEAGTSLPSGAGTAAFQPSAEAGNGSCVALPAQLLLPSHPAQLRRCRWAACVSWYLHLVSPNPFFFFFG